MRYIDADKLIKELNEAQDDINPNDYYKGLGLAKRMVGEMATEDVVPVVRCRECKFRGGSCCDYSAVYIHPNGFCHWGRRSTEMNESED